jgi:catalase
MEPSPALRIIEGPRAPKSIEGRTIAILIADGSDAGVVDELTSQIGDAGGRPVIVAPKIGGAKMSDGSVLEADFQLAGGPSVLFDAIAVILSEDGCTQLLKEAAAVQFVMDAFGHLKAIGHTAEAQPLLDKAGVEPDEGVTDLGATFIKTAATRIWAREPKVRMLA